MLIRFVIEKLDSDSGRRQGLFQAAKNLRESDRLSKRDDEALEELRAWFNANLEKPDRLAWSSKPNAKAQGLSWFKHTAVEHIAKMRAFAQILERYDVAVHMIKTDRPGYILYEDEYQIAAYPFSDTPT